MNRAARSGVNAGASWVTERRHIATAWHQGEASVPRALGLAGTVTDMTKPSLKERNAKLAAERAISALEHLELAITSESLRRPARTTCLHREASGGSSFFDGISSLGL